MIGRPKLTQSPDGKIIEFDALADAQDYKAWVLNERGDIVCLLQTITPNIVGNKVSFPLCSLKRNTKYALKPGKYTINLIGKKDKDESETGTLVFDLTEEQIRSLELDNIKWYNDDEWLSVRRTATDISELRELVVKVLNQNRNNPTVDPKKLQEQAAEAEALKADLEKFKKASPSLIQRKELDEMEGRINQKITDLANEIREGGGKGQKKNERPPTPEEDEQEDRPQPKPARSEQAPAPTPQKSEKGAWQIGSAWQGALIAILVCAIVGLMAWSFFQTGFIFRSIPAPMNYGSQVTPPPAPAPTPSPTASQSNPKREMSDEEVAAREQEIKEAQRRFLASEGGNTPPILAKKAASEQCSPSVVNGNLFINNGTVNIETESSECKTQTQVYKRKKCSLTTSTNIRPAGQMVKMWEHWSPTPMAGMVMFDSGGQGFFYNDQPALYGYN